MKNHERIYKLPSWYWENERKANRNAEIRPNIIDPCLIDWGASFENTTKIEKWIVDEIWNGDDEDIDFLAKRLAFLWELRDKDNDKYIDMSIEKDYIVDIDNEDGKIVSAARKIYRRA